MGEKVLIGIGICGCIYALSVLLRLWTVFVSSRHLSFSRFLGVLYCIFSILSFPIFIFAHLHADIDKSNLRDEMIDSNNKSCDFFLQREKKLEDEIESLKDRIWDERFNSRKEGYADGKKAGYRNGFEAGFLTCYESNDLPSEDKWQSLMDAFSEDEASSNIFSIKPDYLNKDREHD